MAQSVPASASSSSASGQIPINKRQYISQKFEELGKQIKFMNNVYTNARQDSSKYAEVSLDDLQREIRHLQQILRMDDDKANVLINQETRPSIFRG